MLGSCEWNCESGMQWNSDAWARAGLLGRGLMQMFRSAWLCCMTLVLVPCCFRHSHSSWSFRCSLRYVNEAERYPPLPTQKNIACCYWTHIPLKGKGKEWMEHLLNSTLCPFITILQHWWLLSLFQNYGNVFSAVMPASRATCVRFWRRQSGDAKYWKFLYVMFCFFTVGCRAR